MHKYVYTSLQFYQFIVFDTLLWWACYLCNIRTVEIRRHHKKSGTVTDGKNKISQGVHFHPTTIDEHFVQTYYVCHILGWFSQNYVCPTHVFVPPVFCVPPKWLAYTSVFPSYVLVPLNTVRFSFKCDMKPMCHLQCR